MFWRREIINCDSIKANVSCSVESISNNFANVPMNCFYGNNALIESTSVRTYCTAL